MKQSPSVESKKGNLDFNALLKKYDAEARFRLLQGWQAVVVALLAAAMAYFHFATAGAGLLPIQMQGAIHLAFALTLTLVLYPARKKKGLNNRVPLYDFILVFIGLATTLYLVVNYTALTQRAGMPTGLDLLMGGGLIIILLEATRRISNPVLPILAILALLYCYMGRYTDEYFLGVGILLLFALFRSFRRMTSPARNPLIALLALALMGLIYAYFAHRMPESFVHRGFSITRIINHMYLGTEGIFGTPLEVSSTFVFVFILFGSVLEKAGVGKFIIDLALALAGRSTGGPAKVAVLASGLMGTVSGSSVANVCTTGMFTIPLMKSVGYRPHFAGAVEAVASTGGQIMPPVMGAGAFIMAQFLGETYITVAVAAIVPALLYYCAVLIQVHLEAQRLGLKGIAKENLPNVFWLLRTRGFLLLPLAVIIYLLLGGFTPLMAAFWGIISCIPLSYLNKETRLTPKKLFEAFENGARGALSVACACACVGLIVGTSTLTGLALGIANTIMEFSGGMLLPTLLLTMCASILLGTGLPTTANFIVTSTMAAPAILKTAAAIGMDIPPIAVYMFVFYFGIAADLTPPVALAAYAGSGIAKADPMQTGGTAFKLALGGFIIPYIYIYNPILLFVDATPLPMIQAIATALLGVFLLATATIGFFRAPMPLWMRAVALAGSLGLLDPSTTTDIIGITVLVFLFVVQTARKRKHGLLPPNNEVAA